MTSSGNPYEPGRFLHLSREFPVEHCRILKAFEGKPGFGFTNSCTILVEFVGLLPENLKSYKRAIIKSFDPNFCAGIRESYNVSHISCNEVGADNLDNPPERVSFRKWLRSLVPECALQTGLLKTLIVNGNLPPRPQYCDLVFRGLSLIGFMKVMYEEALFKELLPNEVALAIEMLCEDFAKHEELMLSYMTNNDPSHTFPLFLGAARITHSSLSMSTAATDTMQVDCSAVIMEYVEGESLTQWLMRHQQALQQITELEGFEQLLQDVKDICNGCVIANAVPVIFAIQPMDIRTDNFQVCRNEAGRLQIRALDAGGQLLASQAHQCDHRCSVWQVPQKCPRLHFSTDTYPAYRFDSLYFRPELDSATVGMLKEAFQDSFIARQYLSIELLHLDLFKMHEEALDTLFSQIIRQAIWYFEDKTVAVEKLRYTLDLLQKASKVINLTMTTTKPRQYWGWVAFERMYFAFYGQEVRSATRDFIRIVHQGVSELEASGVTDLAMHLELHPEFVQPLAKQVHDVILHNSFLRQHQSSFQEFSDWLDHRWSLVQYSHLDMQPLHNDLKRSRHQYPTTLLRYVYPDETA